MFVFRSFPGIDSEAVANPDQYHGPLVKSFTSTFVKRLVTPDLWLVLHEQQTVTLNQGRPLKKVLLRGLRCPLTLEFLPPWRFQMLVQ